MRTLEDRFDAKFIAIGSGSCWLWTGAIGKHGDYGRLRPGRRSDGPAPAHRVSWELHHGPIPPGLCVLHRCDNPPCVNPEHLFLGTQADNVSDMKSKGREANRKGESGPNARLTDKQVAEIRALKGRMSKVEIGARFGVSGSYVSQLLNGKRRPMPAGQL